MILPFDVAPVQIAFILINEKEELIKYYQEILESLSSVYRCQLYNKNKQINLNILQADKEGCPFKIIIGVNELKNNEITLIRRDNVERKITINLENKEAESNFLHNFKNNLTESLEKYSLQNETKEKLVTDHEEIINSAKKDFKKDKIVKVFKQEIVEFQKQLYQKSVDFRNEHIYSTDNLEELKKKISAGTKGLFLIPFCNNLECEKTIKEKLPSYSIRCIDLEKKNILNLCLFCQAKAQNMVYLGRSY